MYIKYKTTLTIKKTNNPIEIKAAPSRPHPMLALIIIAIIMIAPTMTTKKLDSIYNKPTTTT
ncbi:hypothetical protein [Persephonella sp. KM09-Lau-8]|uniref:hypothetical protein n=1 Tax=Persephonella sp. KM09-Lau-8 TaxID=1158345 RepID=UPI0012DC6BED|nr:hypothetical protein [Persephonella sp. KM09-Lau-8]